MARQDGWPFQILPFIVVVSCILALHRCKIEGNLLSYLMKSCFRTCLIGEGMVENT